MSHASAFPVDATSSIAPATATGPEHGVIDDLLRRRSHFIDRLVGSDIDFGAAARSLLLVILVGGAIFGATIGAYRGGIQILYAAIKLPALLLFTAAICAPVLTLTSLATGGKTTMRRDVVLCLAALALTTLVMAALAPILLLVVLLRLDYHTITLVLFAICSIAGFIGVIFLARGIRRARGGLSILVLLVVLGAFGMVGAQMSWTLRPFLVRPRAVEAPFLRAQEHSFLWSLRWTLDSARGRYHQSYAPLPGETRDSPPRRHSEEP